MEFLSPTMYNKLEYLNQWAQLFCVRYFGGGTLTCDISSGGAVRLLMWSYPHTAIIHPLSVRKLMIFRRWVLSSPLG